MHSTDCYEKVYSIHIKCILGKHAVARFDVDIKKLLNYSSLGTSCFIAYFELTAFEWLVKIEIKYIS